MILIILLLKMIGITIKITFEIVIIIFMIVWLDRLKCAASVIPKQFAF